MVPPVATIEIFPSDALHVGLVMVPVISIESVEKHKKHYLKIDIPDRQSHLKHSFLCQDLLNLLMLNCTHLDLSNSFGMVLYLHLFEW